MSWIWTLKTITWPTWIRSWLSKLIKNHIKTNKNRVKTIKNQLKPIKTIKSMVFSWFFQFFMKKPGFLFFSEKTKKPTTLEWLNLALFGILYLKNITFSNFENSSWMLILSAIFCRQNIFKKPQKSTQKHPKCANEWFCIHDTEPNYMYFPRICNENWRIMQFNIG